MTALTRYPVYPELVQHQKEMAATGLRELFERDEERFDRFHLELDGLLFDYSKNMVRSSTFDFLGS